MGNQSSKAKAKNGSIEAPAETETQIDPNSKLTVRSSTGEAAAGAAAADTNLEPLTEEEVEAAAQSDVDAREERLVRIPGALVHLIDEQQSVLLASGAFSLTKLVQNDNEIVVFARVGKDLKWPLLKDEVTTKLDSAHYFFTLRVDPGDDLEDKKSDAAEKQESVNLNYGVTFKVKRNEDKLKQLDELLEKYSFFSQPKLVQGTEEDKEVAAQNPDETPGTIVPSEVVKDLEKQPSEEKSRLYWTTLAPNVEDYNTSIAKGIASGTGQVIKGIFWLSNTSVNQLEKGGKFLRKHSKACEKPSEISPLAMRNIKRVRRVTRMSEQVARGVLTGIITATSFFTTAAVKSKVGKKFFKMMPGEVALASLDAFGKVFDALEMAGQNVLESGTLVTTGVVSHKFGDQAAEFTHEGMASVGHVLSTAWVISKIRNALNPKAAKTKSTTGMLKSAAKAAVGRKK